MTGRRERKKQQLREQILDAATELGTEHGLEATTISRIAARADISETTFFNYFHSKADLTDALMHRLVDLLEALLDDALASKRPVADRIRLIFAGADLEVLHHGFVRDLVADAVRSGRNSHSLGRLRKSVSEIVAHGQTTGEVRSDHPPEVLGDAVAGLFTSVTLQWTTDDSYPISDRLRSTCDLAIDLISPPRP